ncbi:hypothetical protein GCM10010393_48540 [Streptomyces gobitricini]|uniref:Uncharacterized protein n=1 Tax=Streptomyces gobitricini TaxID=68211 RepID=A0ABP6A9X5_9ACTN
MAPPPVAGPVAAPVAGAERRDGGTGGGGDSLSVRHAEPAEEPVPLLLHAGTDGHDATGRGLAQERRKHLPGGDRDGRTVPGGGVAPTATAPPPPGSRLPGAALAALRRRRAHPRTNERSTLTLGSRANAPVDRTVQ